MRGKRASGTKHARIRETIYRIFELSFQISWPYLCSQVLHVLVVLGLLILAKREFTPAILFLFGLRIIH